MQEDIEQKTIALSVRSERMTASVLQKALRSFLESQKHKSHQLPHGKQSLKSLMKQNVGVSSIEVSNDNIKQFESTAKKYNIDFALRKDSSLDPPRYIVFFKGRDTDVMTAAFKEFSNKNLQIEQKPSIRKLISQMKEKTMNYTKIKNNIELSLKKSINYQRTNICQHILSRLFMCPFLLVVGDIGFV